ncbi:protein nrt1/ ptr family 2.13 [Quercus suber]|uniref:Protein nrt1/ ptr family 2.13 n=1 Tax=Quercus suber TaxID=58331 RepID=A0AAW0KT59_QUESU
MLTVTLTAWLPELHPPQCTKQVQNLGQCTGPTKAQLGILIMGLGFLSIGSGGVRPCSIPFGVDQFDPTSDEGRKGINSFFNWYYTTFTVILLFTQEGKPFLPNPHRGPPYPRPDEGNFGERLTPK